MKRFYKQVTVAESAGNFFVELDGRRVRSPVRRDLPLPTRSLADAIASEWSAQGEEVDAWSMPLFGFAATVADRVIPQRGFVVDELAGYGGSDLICYRAEHPEDLVARQRDGWDPLLRWLEERFGVRLATTAGIMPVGQDQAALAGLRTGVEAVDDWRLAPLHTLTTVSGSLVIGLSVLHARLSAEAAFETSLVDEIYQAEKWGLDREAEERRRRHRGEMVQAGKFIELLGP